MNFLQDLLGEYWCSGSLLSLEVLTVAVLVVARIKAWKVMICQKSWRFRCLHRVEWGKNFCLSFSACSGFSPPASPPRQAAPGGRPGDGGLSMRHHAMGSHPGGHLLLQDSGDGFVKALGELSAKRICSLGPVVCEEHDVGGDMRALQGSCNSPHRAAWFAWHTLSDIWRAELGVAVLWDTRVRMEVSGTDFFRASGLLLCAVHKQMASSTV